MVLRIGSTEVGSVEVVLSVDVWSMVLPLHFNGGGILFNLIHSVTILYFGVLYFLDHLGGLFSILHLPSNVFSHTHPAGSVQLPLLGQFG